MLRFESADLLVGDLLACGPAPAGGSLPVHLIIVLILER